MAANKDADDRLKPLSLHGIEIQDALHAAMEAPPPEESRRPKQKRAKKKPKQRRAKGNEKRARKKPREK